MINADKKLMAAVCLAFAALAGAATPWENSEWIAAADAKVADEAIRIVPGAGHGCGPDGLDKWLFSKKGTVTLPRQTGAIADFRLWAIVAGPGRGSRAWRCRSLP